MIKGISAQLPERWKIKIGGHGEKRKSKTGKEYRLPVKYDHIKICTLEKDENDNYIVDKELMQKVGNPPDKPQVISPVLFLYNEPDLNFFTAYRRYENKVCVCMGDGEKAKKLPSGEEIPCNPFTCEYAIKGYCKPNGILSVVFPDAPLGGVAKFRTTSWNSIRSIYSGLCYFHQLAGGRLTGIPFALKLNKKTSEVEGKLRDVYFLSIEFRGDIAELRQKALMFAKENAEQLSQLEQAEMQARKKLAFSTPLDEDDEADGEVEDEFYPQYEKIETSDGEQLVVDKNTGEVVDIPEKPKKKATFKKKTKPEPKPEPVKEAEPVSTQGTMNDLI